MLVLLSNAAPMVPYRTMAQCCLFSTHAMSQGPIGAPGYKWPYYALVALGVSTQNVGSHTNTKPLPCALHSRFGRNLGKIKAVICLLIHPTQLR
jgi:hypothetical protein